MLQRLVTALGASAFVGDAIVSRPELADVILFESGTQIDPRAEIAAELAVARTPAGDAYEARDALVSALRRAKRRSMIEVASADLAGIIDTREATRLLSDLADQVLEQSVRFETGDDPRGLAVIAVGKLGGRDIGYGSDLDVLFIYDPAAAPDPDEAAPYFVRRAQRIIRSLSEPNPAGPGYELDTRLRPSGSHGLLVTSLSSFATYHGVQLGGELSGQARPGVLSSGAAWERQALLRARACAGDRELAQRTIAVAEVAAYERGAPAIEEMHRLRLRMEHELARERDGRYDLKTGCGGLLDVEFATQWLQMSHGADRRVRTTNTLDALDALFTCGYVRRAEYDVFREGYVFLRRLEQRIHVLHGQGSTLLDVRAPGLAQLARRMGLQGSAGFGAKETLVSRYRHVTGEIRAAYERVLGLGTAHAASRPR
jgi:glutamate-ammonia-ligase adenylyltransferase